MKKLFSIFCCLLLSAGMVVQAQTITPQSKQSAKIAPMTVYHPVSKDIPLSQPLVTELKSNQITNIRKAPMGKYDHDFSWTSDLMENEVSAGNGTAELWKMFFAVDASFYPAVQIYFTIKKNDYYNYGSVQGPKPGTYTVSASTWTNYNYGMNSKICNNDNFESCFYTETGAKGNFQQGGTVKIEEGKDGYPYVTCNVNVGVSLLVHIGEPLPTYNVNVIKSPEDITATITGSGTFKQGKSTTLTVSNVQSDYHFDHWEDGGNTSSNTSYTINNIQAAHDVTAVFVPNNAQQYTINTAVNDDALGSVTVGGKKSDGSTFNIEATPNDRLDYYLSDWLKNGDSMGVKTNPLPVVVVSEEDGNTYTAVFTARTQKTLFCDDDMTFAGNGPYTFSGTATDAQNNEYNISLSTTNVSQGNFSVQEKTNAINSITSKSGTVTTSQLSNTYYAVNAVVIGSDEVRYDISGGFPLAASGSWNNFTISELVTAAEVTVPGPHYSVESPFYPSDQKLIHLIAHRTSPQTKNYVELWIKAPAQQYNSKIGPVEGTYQSYAPSFSCSSGWSFNYATGLIGYNDDGCWNDGGDHYTCYLSSYCCDQLDLRQQNESYFRTNTTVSVERGKNGDMFVVINKDGSPYIVIGEPAGPPTLVLGETTNGTFSATDGTKNYTAGRYKMPIGAQLSLTATPAEDYVVAKWLLNGEEVRDELGNLMKATELTYTVASEDVVDDKITIVPVFGEKSDCTMAFDDIAVELNEQEHSARLVATNSVGGVAVLDFIGLTSFDEQIGVSAGTYTIGTDLVVGNAVAQTGSYVTDGSSTWNLASGTITIAKANGKMTLTTSSVKSTDPQDVTLTATDITCSVIRRITYVINDALYSDNNDGRFRFIGTIGNKEINICFYGDESNPVGTYTNDEIYDGDYPNNYVTIADVKCYNVQYATVTKDGNHYILDAEFDNPNGGYYHVIMKALVPKNDDTMEDYLVTRNVSSSYVTFAESDITVTQQAEGYQYLHAKTGGDNYMEAKMYFYTGSAESGIPTGTYTISDSQQPGTVRMMNSTAYRSYTKTNWYIAQGTVTVVHQNNHYYIVVRAFNTRYKANDNRLYTVNFTIGTEITAQTYKVTFYDEDGETELQSSDVEYNTRPSCTEPTKDATAQYTYTFAGWTDGTNTYSTADLPVVTGEAAYTATYTETKRKYTVTWKNGDSVLETDENVEYGETPSYDGEDPTRAEDENFSYTFAGWTDGTNTYSTADLPVVTDDATYTATYTSLAKAFVLYDDKNKNDSYYTTTLKGLEGQEISSVTYDRNFAAKTWNVFSLPFNYLLAGSGHSFEGNVYELASTDYDYTTDWLSLNFMPVTTILQANRPYLFYSSTDVNTPVFEKVTMAELTTNYYTVTNTGAGGSIEFRNTTYRQQLEKNNSHIVFITNNKLYYMGGNNIYMRAFRGYFYLNDFALNTSAAPRVRIVLNGQTATELEVVSDMPASENGVRKYIENGTLVIEREGVRYDATGAKMN